MDRRKFLSGAAQSAIALPLLADAAHAATHSTRAQPRKITGATPLPPRPNAVHLNVRDFGATGDGKTMDTLAVQQALDRCNLDRKSVV